MEKKFKEFIEQRCEARLLESEEYRDIQTKFVEAYNNNDIETYSELSLRMQLIVEDICYKSAIKDVLLFLTEK